jgi:tetratricopeptide (TPR) repeat protein
MGHDAATNPAAPPPSRLLQHLIQEAGTAQDQQVWARAVCLAAAHQARAGMLDEAPASLGLVREAYGPGVNPETACWLILSEGILQWCLFDASHGYARMRGAHALAMSMGADSAASCAAWMALLEFNASQYDRMALHLTEVFEHARSDDHLARARAALVIATAYHYAGDFTAARPWYEETRLHAVAVGDENTWGAMLHNMATFRLANVRFDDAFGELNTTELDRASIEAQGSATYDFATHNTVHPSMRYLMLGQLYVSERKYGLALEQFQLVDIPAFNHNNTEALVKTDSAWCMHALGETAQSLALAAEALRCMDRLVDTDDQAYVNARLAAIFRATPGHEALASRLQSSAQQAREAHMKTRANMILSLASIRARPILHKEKRPD